MFGMCKTKHSSEDCNRYLFIVSKIDILWSFRELASSLIINFEQVIKPFLVLNIFSLFSYQWLITLFTRALLIVTVCYYYITYAPEAVVNSCSVKKAFFEISQNSQENACARVSFLKKRLWHRCFPVNFATFLRTFFLTEHLRWLLLTFQSESTLYSFRASCSKQAQYLKFKSSKTSWKYHRSNIVQTSFLCYVAGFKTPSMKMCSTNEV